MKDPSPFFTQLQDLESQGKQDGALDLIYDTFDARLWQRDLEWLREALRIAASAPMAYVYSVCMLTATLPDKEALRPERTLLFEALRQQLIDNGDEAEIELRGLEP